MKCKGIMKIVDKKTGKVILERHNRFVTVGLNSIAALLNGESSAIPTHIAVGTSSAAIANSQTALVGTELARVVFDSHVRTGNSIELVATFGVGTGTGAWEEAGIFSASTAGIMFSRVLTGTYTKRASDVFEVRWTYTIQDDGVD
jgi:hypothetical protein